jgi:hypothetical protein
MDLLFSNVRQGTAYHAFEYFRVQNDIQDFGATRAIESLVGTSCAMVEIVFSHILTFTDKAFFTHNFKLFEIEISV